MVVGRRRGNILLRQGMDVRPFQSGDDRGTVLGVDPLGAGGLAPEAEALLDGVRRILALHAEMDVLRQQQEG